MFGPRFARLTSPRAAATTTWTVDANTDADTFFSVKTATAKKRKAVEIRVRQFFSLSLAPFLSTISTDKFACFSRFLQWDAFQFGDARRARFLCSVVDPHTGQITSVSDDVLLGNNNSNIVSYLRCALVVSSSSSSSSSSSEHYIDIECDIDPDDDTTHNVSSVAAPPSRRRGDKFVVAA
jgi:hypothetical protein